MQKKYLKIVGTILLVAGMVVSISLSARQKTNWGRLMKENVEALTAVEVKPYPPCVHAKGFCIRHGLDIDGLALVISKE